MNINIHRNNINVTPTAENRGLEGEKKEQAAESDADKDEGGEGLEEKKKKNRRRHLDGRITQPHYNMTSYNNKLHTT